MAPRDTSRRSAQGLAELIEHLQRKIHGASFACGLVPAQWSALRFLNRANSSARTLSGFVEFHAATKGTAAQTLRALRRKKLIRQRQSTEDRRVRYYELTPKGLRTMRQDPLLPLVAAIQGLPEEQVADLAMSIQGLVRAWIAASPSGETPEG